jgi:hypothetical protein
LIDDINLKKMSIAYSITDLIPGDPSVEYPAGATYSHTFYVDSVGHIEIGDDELVFTGSDEWLFEDPATRQLFASRNVRVTGPCCGECGRRALRLLYSSRSGSGAKKPDQYETLVKSALRFTDWSKEPLTSAQLVKGSLQYLTALGKAEKDFYERIKLWQPASSHRSVNVFRRKHALKNLSHDVVLCHCGHPAVKRTVKKEDSRHVGKDFWSCIVPFRTEGCCSFFSLCEQPRAASSTDNSSNNKSESSIVAQIRAMLNEAMANERRVASEQRLAANVQRLVKRHREDDDNDEEYDDFDE